MQPPESIEAKPCGDPTLWHLCWQASVGRDFLFDTSLSSSIRGRIVDAHRQLGRVLVDYLLTPTELHTVSEIAVGDSVSRIARAVGNVVARWVRNAQPMNSPVLAGRYRAHKVVSVEEIRIELRMLAWRPVLLGLCSTPSHYPFGALRIALGLTPAQGFNARPMLRLFDDSIPKARALLRAWVANRPSPREARRWELARGLALATGTIGPQPHTARIVRTDAAAALVAAGGSDGVDGAVRLLEAWISVRLGWHGPQALQLSIAGRGRALVACLAVDHALCSAASAARHFHRAKATLSEQMTACRNRPADRQILKTPIYRIIEEALIISLAKP